MCLITRDVKPRIAKQDIVVLKYLRLVDNQYYTPFFYTPVTLDKMLIPNRGTPDMSTSRYALGEKLIIIQGGVIHATLIKNNPIFGFTFKAIIPKGTKYWIDICGNDIASEKILITKELANESNINNSLAKEILKDSPEINGIKVGDYQMIDNSFIHPTESIQETKARGIVCGFYEGGKPIICALKKFRTNWSNRHFSLKEESDYNDIKLFNGKEITQKYIQLKNDHINSGAFNKCINYRKDKGENWFFGSYREVLTMAENAIYLNAAHKITGLGFRFKTSQYYWSSSEKNIDASWCISINPYFNSNDCSLKKFYMLNIVPFYDFSNESNIL